MPPRPIYNGEDVTYVEKKEDRQGDKEEEKDAEEEVQDAEEIQDVANLGWIQRTSRFFDQNEVKVKVILC